MKVLLVACLCIVPVIARPSGGTSSISSTDSIQATATSSTSTSNNRNNKREAATKWRPIGPAISHTTFRVISVPKAVSGKMSYEMNDIPARTRTFFTAPEQRTKEARQLHFFAGTPEAPIPTHAHHLLNDIVFFDTIDHGKLVTALQQRRKYAGLPPHVLKSLRPYFPFFSYE